MEEFLRKDETSFSHMDFTQLSPDVAPQNKKKVVYNRKMFHPSRQQKRKNGALYENKNHSDIA